MTQKEAAVQSVLTTITTMDNPFEGSSDGPLYNVSSGSIAPSDVSNDLLTAQTIGEKRFQEFIKTRLQSNGQTTILFSPVERKH